MKHFLLSVVLLSAGLLYAQDNGQQESNAFNYDLELSKMVRIPNSPEAQAFARYGNTQVNMYSGAPDISVPIHVFKGRELDLPISLNYDATGIKVEQLATQAGLGWNLNAGGRISRIINGHPDDFNTASGAYLSFMNDDNVQQQMLSYIAENQIFPSQQAVMDYLDFLKNVNDGFYDTQPDYFSLNVPGLNDHLIFDVATRQPKALNNPRLKISFTKDFATKSVTSWTVTHENGTVYHFAQAENTYAQSTDIGPGLYGIVKDYNSSWVLTKIESPNKKDVYDLSYTSLGMWLQPQPASTVQIVRNDVNDLNPGADNYGINPTPSATTDYQIDQLFLSEIHHNGKKVASIDLKNREDLDIASAIDRINLHRPEDGQVYRYFVFEHSYFGNANSPDMAAKRLKLDLLTSYSALGDVYQRYGFEYINPDGVPSRRSLGQDYLGYYNGADSNTVLYPPMKLGEDTYEGANRAPQFAHAKTGLLKKISYPTGGITEFEYEAHKTPYNNADLAQEDPQTVVYGTLNLMGGTDPATVCGLCCQDQYSGNPKVVHQVFNITEAGNYKISYGFSGMQSIMADGYLFYRGVPPGSKTFPQLPYEQIIGDGCEDLVGLVWQNAQGSEVTVNLVPGNYQITLVNKSAGDVATLQVFRDDVILPAGTLGQGEVERAGIRIQSITDYSETGQIAQSKAYQYKTTLNGDTASGELIFKPVLQYNTLEAVLIQPDDYNALNNGMDSGINVKTVANRVASSSGGDRPHVAYSRVYEIVTSETPGTPVGYSEYNFNTGSTGIFSYGGSKNANYYLINSEVGKQNQVSVYNDQGQALSRQDFTYGQHSFYTNYGIFTTRKGEDALKYMVIKPVAGGYTYELLNPTLTGFSGAYGNGTLYAGPPQVAYDAQCDDSTIDGTTIPCFCNDVDPCVLLMSYCDYYPDHMCIDSQSYSTLQLWQTSAGGKVGTTVSMQRIDYFDSENITTTTTYDYSDASIDHLLRESVTTSSDTDQVITVRNHYPKDDNVTGTNLLQQQNRLAEVVKTETYINGVHAVTQEKEYIGLNPGVVMPAVVSTKRDTSAVEERLEFTFYGNGNLKEAFRPNGSHSTYIWGYDSTLLMARLDGFSYSDLDPVVLLNLNFLSGNDIDPVSEQALRDELNALRDSLPGVAVTTYTHDPPAGVSSITDPKGHSAFYNYDPFNRLTAIKDGEGNTVKVFNYNYAEEAVVYDPLVTGISYGSDGTDHQWFLADASGGSGDYSYQWFEGIDALPDNFEANASGTNDNYQLMTNCNAVKYVKLVVTDNITGESVQATKVSNNSCNYMPLIVGVGYGSHSDTYQNFTSSVSGGSGNVTYNWYKGVGTSSFTYEVTPAGNLPNFQLQVSCNSFKWVKLVVTDTVTGEVVIKNTKSNNSPCSGGGGNPPQNPQQPDTEQ